MDKNCINVKDISDYHQNNENNNPIKEEFVENDFDASLSVKMEPCGINITEVIKEEETRENLSDYENIYDMNVFENIDKIDIEEFKLEEPDV